MTDFTPEERGIVEEELKLELGWSKEVCEEFFERASVQSCFNALVTERIFRNRAKKEIAELRESIEEDTKTSCPCHYGNPCHPSCTCAQGGFSAGCCRCCRYGSDEQKQETAKGIIRRESDLASLAEELSNANASIAALRARVEELENELKEAYRGRMSTFNEDGAQQTL